MNLPTIYCHGPHGYRVVSSTDGDTIGLSIEYSLWHAHGSGNPREGRPKAHPWTRSRRVFTTVNECHRYAESLFRGTEVRR